MATKLPRTCPVCPVRLQVLERTSAWPDFAGRHAEALGVDIPGPMIYGPLGSLIAHHAMVHDDLDLADFIDSYYDQ